MPNCSGPVSFLGTTASTLLIARGFYALTRRGKLNVYFLKAAVCGPSRVVSVLRLPRLIVPITAVAMKCPSRYPPRISHLPVRNVLRRRLCRSCAGRSVSHVCECGRSLPRGRRFVGRGRGRALTRMFARIECGGSSGRYVSMALGRALGGRNFRG